MHNKGERTCIVCKEKFQQNTMTRIYRIGNKIFVGKNKVGKGAYICKNSSCINNLIRYKSLNKTFKCNFNLDDTIIRELLIGTSKD